MTHPRDCPEWEYDAHPDRKVVLKQETQRLIIALRRREIDSRACAADTRQVHRSLFVRLTPHGCEYFAGHYRGEDFRCLRFYVVGIRRDPRVGYAPHLVRGYMAEVEEIVKTAVAGLDAGFELPTAHFADEEKLLYCVAVACRVFEYFLRIHPYVNGNGHAARFIVWALLGRYGYWPVRWPIEPRPPDPPYTNLLEEHRNGNPEPLEKLILAYLSPS